jgi:protein required for attachment to host cells
MTHGNEHRLIAVAGITKLALYIATGKKITTALPVIEIERDGSHRPQKHESHFRQKSNPASLYEPHTSPDEIEHIESARDISDEILKHLGGNHFVEIILIAEPRMLGFLRQHLAAPIKKLISREINKDYLRLTKEELEKAVFA